MNSVSSARVDARGTLAANAVNASAVSIIKGCVTPGDVYNPAGIMLGNLRALFGVMIDIALLRRGPENLPTSTALMAIAIAFNLAVSAIMAVVDAERAAPLAAALAVGTAVTLLWLRVALRSRNKRERFVQTITAMFGVNALFVPAMIPLAGAMLPYMEKRGSGNAAAVRAPHPHRSSNLGGGRAGAHRARRVRMALLRFDRLHLRTEFAGAWFSGSWSAPRSDPLRRIQMHVHILGICGTFMGGIAAIAKAAGHRVTGSDKNVYPPMSTQLEALGIELIQRLRSRAAHATPRCRRGRQCHDARRAGDRGAARQRHSIHVRPRVARARSAARRARARRRRYARQDHDLEHARVDPRIRGSRAGFPDRWRSRELFRQRAARRARSIFVIEADEYDTAFFDKRAKFVHYRPRTAILNNLEFDHADIYEDLGAIQRQFHHLVRTIPASGRILWNRRDANLAAVLAMGAWTPRDSKVSGGRAGRRGAELVAGCSGEAPRTFPSSTCSRAAGPLGTVRWTLARRAQRGECARGDRRRASRRVSPVTSPSRRSRSSRRQAAHGTARRSAGIAVYDDFAHHPTAIASTIDGLRRKVGSKRIVAVLEPRSATMRMGVHRDTLGAFARPRRTRCGCSRHRISAGTPMR